MDILFEKYFNKIKHVSLNFKRSLIEEIQWNARLIGIKGARGVGKTTLLLQYMKENLPQNLTALYVSLDNIWFAENKLTDLADNFVKKGGKYLFLDEVHKYPNWSQELKNIYDDNPDLQIVFTGSSLLEILNARADLSRRAVVYDLQGLSYREYLEIKANFKYPSLSLEEILLKHPDITLEINEKIKPLQHFNSYLQSGYFPYFQEVPELYFHRIEEVINMILEVELPLLRKVEVSYIPKLKQLLQIIALSVPFSPNITKLSERIGVNRNTLTTYLYFLAEANLIINLYKDAKGITQLQKPEKIYLENPNFQFVLAAEKPQKGAIRETFLANQIGYQNLIEYSENGDFKINHQVIIEVGGKNKNNQQIKYETDAFIAADDLEYGFGNKIPLWLFGFLY